MPSASPAVSATSVSSPAAIDKAEQYIKIAVVYSGMCGPGGPAGLQNRFADVKRAWRFDSPTFRFLAIGRQLSAKVRRVKVGGQDDGVGSATPRPALLVYADGGEAEG
jgi:hypothetical protein